MSTVQGITDYKKVLKEEIAKFLYSMWVHVAVSQSVYILTSLGQEGVHVEQPLPAHVCWLGCFLLQMIETIPLFYSPERNEQLQTYKHV